MLCVKRFWSSLPCMVKLSIVTSWPEMLWWSYMGDGALRCSFNLSSKFLADSPIYSSSQSTLSHLNLYMTPLFLLIGSHTIRDSVRATKTFASNMGLKYTWKVVRPSKTTSRSQRTKTQSTKKWGHIQV